MDAMESVDPQKTVAVQDVGQHRRNTIIGAEDDEDTKV